MPARACGNGLVISERKLNRAVIDELRKLLASKEIQARFIDGFTKRLRNKDPVDDRERAALEAEVKSQESRVRNVTAAIAGSGFSEALAEQLGLEEETLRSLRQRLAAKVPAGERPAAVPDPDAVARFLEKVLEIAETAPKRASVSLSRILVPITLVPVKDSDGTRRYEARGALNTNPAALSDGRVSANASCGGLMDGFSPTEEALYTRRINPSCACSFPGCDRPLHGAGLCDGHRTRSGGGCP
jgi:hypothetical protein